MGADHQVNRVIFFDGVCNLCNSSVQFILKRDKRQLFRFSSLQSEYATSHLPSKCTQNLQTIILQEGEHIYTKSSAALRIAKHLPGGWKLLYVLLVIPKVVRDLVYDFIANNRYRWFGQKDQCMMPSPDLRDRFFD